MKHPSEVAMNVVRKHVTIIESPDLEDETPWGVFVGGDGGIREFFDDEHKANKAALHVMYSIAHAIDALIAKVKREQTCND